MADLTLRLVKGTPLTNAEVDANFSNLNEAITVGGEPMGHVDKTQSTLSFDAGTRTITIAPVSGSFTVWVKGTKFVFTTAQSVVIPDTTGLHYVFFNTSGVLSTHMTFFDWPNEAPTAYVAWNSATASASFFADERHGVTLDWQTHEYLHRTRGAAFASGFSISNYTVVGTGSSDADAQFDLSGGTFFDEDLQVDVVNTNSPTPNTWEQDLAGPAQIPVFYRSGTGWVRDNPTNFVLKAGVATPRYNTESGGVWGLTDVPNNNYSNVWILATNNLTYPVIAVMGQYADNSATNVENREWSQLNLAGFPAVEFRPLYKIVFQCGTGYANTIKARFTKVFDIRNVVSASPAATIGSTHGALAGLGADDHLQYLHITEVRSPSQAVKNSLLPAQTGNSGKFLTTDGENPSWATMTAPNNGTLTLAVSGPGLSGSASFTADQAGNSTFTVTSNASSANVVDTLVVRDGSGNFAANVITANSFSGSASGLTGLKTINGSSILGTGNIQIDGGVVSFNTRTGEITLTSGDVTSALGYTPVSQSGSYADPAWITSVSWGKISSTPTTLAGYGITDAQALDADLTAIAALTGTSGLLRKDAANSWSLDTTGYLTANQSITLSGDATGTGTTAISVVLANSGVTAGTYRSVTVDGKGRVTAGTNPTTLSGYGITDAQATLVSGTNIKTINNSSILGSGNLTVSTAEATTTTLGTTYSSHNLGGQSTALGYNSAATNASTTVGNGASADQLSIAIGTSSTAANTRSVAIGNSSDGQFDSVAVGWDSTAYSNSVAIGSGVQATIANTVALGSGQNNVTPFAPATAGFFVTTVRSQSGGQTATGTLKFDNTTKEIFYDTAAGGVVIQSSDNTVTVTNPSPGVWDLSTAPPPPRWFSYTAYSDSGQSPPTTFDLPAVWSTTYSGPQAFLFLAGLPDAGAPTSLRPEWFNLGSTSQGGTAYLAGNGVWNVLSDPEPYNNSTAYGFAVCFAIAPAEDSATNYSLPGNNFQGTSIFSASPLYGGFSISGTPLAGYCVAIIDSSVDLTSSVVVPAGATLEGAFFENGFLKRTTLFIKYTGSAVLNIQNNSISLYSLPSGYSAAIWFWYVY